MLWPFLLENLIIVTSLCTFSESMNLMMNRRLATLLVATTKDVASLNIANSIVTRYPHIWDPQDERPESSVWRYNSLSGNKIFMWIQNESLLRLDHVDKIFKARYPALCDDVTLDEVIFLSKHSAASGKSSLTVHPIGIPWQVENERSGGIPGRCSPPNRRIASLYRQLLESTKVFGIEDKFQVTLEATHHGPFVTLPTCFVEIGSTDADYPIPEAGQVWAHCLGNNFGFPLESCSPQSSSSVVNDESCASNANDARSTVVCSIGGGHYVPKTNDAARLGDHILIGHCLATYTLQGHLDGTMTVEQQVPGGWEAIILETIESTKIGYPGIEIVCLVDKKAFKSEHRQQITDYLTDLGIQWTYKFAEIKAIAEKRLQSSLMSP